MGPRRQRPKGLGMKDRGQRLQAFVDRASFRSRAARESPHLHSLSCPTHQSKIFNVAHSQYVPFLKLPLPHPNLECAHSAWLCSQKGSWCANMDTGSSRRPLSPVTSPSQKPMQPMQSMQPSQGIAGDGSSTPSKQVRTGAWAYGHMGVATVTVSRCKQLPPKDSYKWRAASNSSHASYCSQFAL